MRRRHILFLVLGLLSSGCGEDSPSSPTFTATTTVASTPSRVTLTVVSGETLEPVAGASVTLAGASYQTDGGTVGTSSTRTECRDEDR